MWHSGRFSSWPRSRPMQRPPSLDTQSRHVHKHNIYAPRPYPPHILPVVFCRTVLKHNCEVVSKVVRAGSRGYSVRGIACCALQLTRNFAETQSLCGALLWLLHDGQAGRCRLHNYTRLCYVLLIPQAFDLSRTYVSCNCLA